MRVKLLGQKVLHHESHHLIWHCLTIFYLYTGCQHFRRRQTSILSILRWYLFEFLPLKFTKSEIFHAMKWNVLKGYVCFASIMQHFKTNVNWGAVPSGLSEPTWGVPRIAGFDIKGSPLVTGPVNGGKAPCRASENATQLSCQDPSTSVNFLLAYKQKVWITSWLPSWNSKGVSLAMLLLFSLLCLDHQEVW